MRSIVILCAVLPAICAIPFFPGKPQTVAVEGRLVCNGKPYEHARVRLYDENLALPNKFLAEVRTDKDGAYNIAGTTTRYLTIDPKLNIYHDCNDETKECYRKVEIRIPKDFVAQGEKAEQTFDAGTLNLNAKLSGEGRECIN